MRKKISLSIRWKIFLVMIAVSVLPLTAFTIYAVANSYSSTYEQMAENNENNITWGEERLSLFSDELKENFYTMEFEDGFKKALSSSGTVLTKAENLSTIRQTLLYQLDRKTVFSTIELYLMPSNSKVTVTRSGSFQTDQENVDAVFVRDNEEQTNMFFKVVENELYATHYVKTFPDEKLIAKIAVKLKNKALGDIVDRLKNYDTESVYLLNDELDVLSLEGKGNPEVLSDVITKIQSENYENSTFKSSDNIILYGSTDRGVIKIIKIIPKQEIVNIVKPTVYAGIMLSVLCVVIAIFLSALLSYYVSKPIVELTGKVKGISFKTLKLSADNHASDEVGVLEDHISNLVDKIKDLITKEYESKLEAKSAQIKALQAQINPHFLHNTLQLIGSISLTKEANSVYPIASALSDMMRYSMDFKEDYVTIDKEIGYLNNYLMIQKKRFYDKFEVDLEIQDEIKDCLIPKMILQPLVENSFQHGFEKRTADWKLWVKIIKADDNRIMISVKDNGVGIERKELEELTAELKKNESSLYRKNHIGLMNVNSRIHLYCPEDGSMEIESNKGEGTKLQVFIHQMH